MTQKATDEGDRVYAKQSLAPAPTLDALLRNGGQALVGYVDRSPMACGAVRFLNPTTGEIKRMFVERSWRGRGFGRQLLLALEREAMKLGYERVRLDTGSKQLAALALYRGAGYGEIADYNGQPGAAHWFEKDLGA